ncbi:group II intron maturase-specific domain-containing protein [Enterobacter asburiae]
MDTTGDQRQELQNRSDKSLVDLARMFSAKIRGWVNYYSAFNKSALYPKLRQIYRKLHVVADPKNTNFVAFSLTFSIKKKHCLWFSMLL